MKKLSLIILSLTLVTTSFSAFARQRKMRVKAPAQRTYDAAVSLGRAWAQEIDRGENEKANRWMRHYNCEYRRGGRFIEIISMNIQEKFDYEGDDFIKVYEPVISFWAKRCENDDD